MQEEIEQKTFNIMISTTKLSARTVLRAVKAAFRLYQSKASQGKQSVRTLLRQNRGVSSVEISKTGIRGLERYAKKYGIDYAIRKDNSEVPPRYLVFFKAPDAEAFHSAFKEYSASLLNKDKRPSVLAKLHELVQAVAQGYRAMALLIVQMGGCTAFRPNWETDPAFCRALRDARAAGVEVRAVDCRVTPDTVTANRELPVDLDGIKSVDKTPAAY